MCSTFLSKSTLRRGEVKKIKSHNTQKVKFQLRIFQLEKRLRTFQNVPALHPQTDTDFIEIFILIE